MSELNKTIEDIAVPKKITVKPKKIKMPVSFNPVDLESTELFCSDLESMNKMAYALTVLRERYPTVSEDVYKESERRLINDDR